MILRNYFYKNNFHVIHVFLGQESDIDKTDPKKSDPEYFLFECLTVEEVEKCLNELVEQLSSILQITPSLAKVLLHEHKWNTNEIIEKYRDNASNLLVMSRVKPPNGKQSNYRSHMCPVCATTKLADKFSHLSCGHSFCKDCWSTHFEIQICQGISTGIGCMAPDCNVRVPEDFVLTLLNRSVFRDKYQQFAFQDYVKSHPQLRFCPGPNCQVI